MADRIRSAVRNVPNPASHFKAVKIISSLFFLTRCSKVIEIGLCLLLYYAETNAQCLNVLLRDKTSKHASNYVQLFCQ